MTDFLHAASPVIAFLVVLVGFLGAASLCVHSKLLEMRSPLPGRIRAKADLSPDVGIAARGAFA